MARNPKAPGNAARPDGDAQIDEEKRPELPATSSIGASVRVGEKTARHDAGSGANETLDGLDSSSEAIRQGAEDTPVGERENIDRIPVFDRAGLPPKT